MSDLIKGDELLHKTYHRLGKCLEQLERWEEAVEAYQRGIELNENSSFSYESLGKLLAEKGQLTLAIQMYRTAIKLNPSFHGFHYNLAQALIGKKDFKNAIAELLSCIDKNCQHYPSYDLIGDLLIEQGQEDELIYLYKQGLLATSHNDTYHQKIIQKLSNLGLDEEKFSKDCFFKNLQVVSDFWGQHIPVSTKNEWIIIEATSAAPPWGFSVTGLNLIEAKYLQKLYGYRIAAWYSNDYIDDELKAVLISFGVEKFIVQNTDSGLSENQKCQLDKFSQEANDKNFKQLMKDFKCDDLHIGDLAYDLLIRNSILSTPIFDQTIRAALESACLAYSFWKNFLHSCQVRYFISSHVTLYHHGLISRLVVAKKGIAASPSTRYETINELYNAPGYIYKKLFLYFWNSYKTSSVKIGKELVENTMGIKNSGAAISYLTKSYGSDKKVYSHPEFCKQLNLDPSLPIVIVASHVLNDCPHCYRDRLFVDYYEWLVETLKVCFQIESINWLIKEHPYIGDISMAYNVDKTAKQLVNNEYSLCQYINLVPDDMSNLSLINFCHAIVTVSGTIAHELACFGIPSILAGSSSYSECGFTNNPQSVDEYKALLYSIHKQNKLPHEEIEKAYVAYAIQHYYMKGTGTNFGLGGKPLSTMENWANRITSNEMGKIEEDPLFKNFMTQIFFKQKSLLIFDELWDMD